MLCFHRDERLALRWTIGSKWQSKTCLPFSQSAYLRATCLVEWGGMLASLSLDPCVFAAVARLLASIALVANSLPAPAARRKSIQWWRCDTSEWDDWTIPRFSLRSTAIEEESSILCSCYRNARIGNRREHGYLQRGLWRSPALIAVLQAWSNCADLGGEFKR